MNRMSKGCLNLFIGVLACSSMEGIAETQQIVLESSGGESYLIDVESEDSFQDVLQRIDSSLTVIELNNVEYQEDADVHTPCDIVSKGFNMSVSDGQGIVVRSIAKSVSNLRSYSAPVTQNDKNDIAYIVKTLANNSLIKIKGAESSLKKAGDRVDRVHPLNFLSTVFTSEELKACMQNLYGRNWVWGRFLDGLTGSLVEENASGNILPYASDFAQRVNIDVNLILPTMQKAQWEKFVEVLIKNVPRSGNNSRYDM